MRSTKDINILVACEFSGRVRDAFTRKGFNAVSCDFKLSLTKGHHIVGDALSCLDLMKWDVLIGFPPCTYLSNVNTKWRKDPERLQKTAEAIGFFAKMLKADVAHIALENPVGVINTCYRKPDQIIQPYYFGGHQKKRTCLWLQNLPLLKHYDANNLFNDRTHSELSSDFLNKHKDGATFWYNNRKKERSIIFNSIANAMAEQWGDFLIDNYNLISDKKEEIYESL